MLPKITKPSLGQLIEDSTVWASGVRSGTIGTIELDGRVFDVNYVRNSASENLLSLGFGKAEATQVMFDQIMARLAAAGGRFTSTTGAKR